MIKPAAAERAVQPRVVREGVVGDARAPDLPSNDILGARRTLRSQLEELPHGRDDGRRVGQVIPVRVAPCICPGHDVARGTLSKALAKQRPVAHGDHLVGAELHE